MSLLTKRVNNGPHISISIKNIANKNKSPGLIFWTLIIFYEISSLYVLKKC
ncbi:hypothetical protein HB162lentus_07880 [Mammaliicoccus lentus]